MRRTSDLKRKNSTARKRSKNAIPAFLLKTYDILNVN